MHRPCREAGDVDDGGSPVATGRAFEWLLTANADPRNLEDRIAAMIWLGSSRYATDLLLRPAIELYSDAWWRLVIAYAPDLHMVDAIVEELTGTARSNGPSRVSPSGGVAGGDRRGG